MKPVVSVTAEKNVDFSKFTTYTWTKGQPSPSQAIDERVVAAVDRELNARGMTKATSGTGDVMVTYYSTSRTDVQVNAKRDASGVRPEHTVGILIVAFLEPSTQKPLIRMRVDQPVDRDPVKLEEGINTAIAALFDKYPTRKR